MNGKIEVEDHWMVFHLDWWVDNRETELILHIQILFNIFAYKSLYCFVAVFIFRAVTNPNPNRRSFIGIICLEPQNYK